MSHKKSGGHHGHHTAEDRRALIEKARIADQTDRFDDMAGYMKEVVKLGRDLGVDERNLLADAYKKHVGVKRAAWRIISEIEQKLDTGQRKRDIIREYRAKIEDELRKSCGELLHLIDAHLIDTIDTENKVFYLKMKGDYYRYLAEFCRDEDEAETFENAKISYEEAMDLAKENLTAAHPLRLGLILNYSVFFYEILNVHEVACELIKDALGVAEDDIKNVMEDSRADSRVIIQLMKDNLRIWTTELSEQGYKLK